ncbi:hypothetical protein HY251_11640 [bacterium]|nr:hypothetical protein [bacterium]
MLTRKLAPAAVVLVLAFLVSTAFLVRADDAKKCGLCEAASKVALDLRCDFCKAAPKPCERCQDVHGKLAEKLACKACEKSKTGTCPACDKALKAAGGCRVCAAKVLVVGRIFCGEKCEKAGKPCEECAKARAFVDAAH